MSTQHDYHVTVAVDGKPLGAFDTRSGGDTDSDVATRWTAGGRKTYPARANTSEVTVGRVFERERDYELCRGLTKRAGKAKVVVTEQPLDEDGNAWGKPTVWTGTLKSVNTGDVDLDSEDPRDLELTIAVQEVN